MLSVGGKVALAFCSIMGSLQHSKIVLEQFIFLNKYPCMVLQIHLRFLDQYTIFSACPQYHILYTMLNKLSLTQLTWCAHSSCKLTLSIKQFSKLCGLTMCSFTSLGGVFFYSVCSMTAFLQRA